MDKILYAFIIITLRKGKKPEVNIKNMTSLYKQILCKLKEHLKNKMTKLLRTTKVFVYLIKTINLCKCVSWGG